MGTIYVDTGGAATNSGCTDQNTANLSGTGDAVATGSVIQLTAGTDLSGVVTSGATQSSIYLAQATNANQKIFWITAKDDALDQVTVSVAPTGVTGSNWAIGGRFVWTPASIEATLVAGDVVVLNNSPAAVSSGSWLTGRAAGSQAAGPIKVKGKTGVRPVVTQNNTSSLISNSQNHWWYENFETAQTGASGSTIASIGPYTWLYNMKSSDAGQSVATLGGYSRVLASEFTGSGSPAAVLFSNQLGCYLHGNYIHDNASDGLGFTGGQNGTFAVLSKNIFDTNAGRGMLFSGAFPSGSNTIWLDGNTVYGNGDSGLEVTDADAVVVNINNIFSENGNAAGEYNIEHIAAAAELLGFHGWNVFYHSGGGGGANLSNLTVNAQVASSEFTTDPLFTNAAGGDFSIGSTSPAKATGFPGQFLGGSLGYLDVGAVQRQEAGGGGPVAQRTLATNIGTY